MEESVGDWDGLTDVKECERAWDPPEGRGMNVGSRPQFQPRDLIPHLIRQGGVGGSGGDADGPPGVSARLHQ